MTINSINSGYNLTQEIQKNTQNTTKEIPTSQNLPQDLVKDKSQAVKEVLGYGVDSEGFFTSDLNEAAGIPKDYRIEAEKIKHRIDFITGNCEGFRDFKWFESVNVAKTLNNVYNEFHNLLNGGEFSKLLGIYDNSYKYNKDKINDMLHNANMSNNEKFYMFRHYTTLEEFIDGEVTFVGRLMGYDKNVSKEEIDSFKAFMESNKIGSILCINKDELPWDTGIDEDTLVWDAKYINLYTKNSEIINMANELYMDYKALIARNDISLEEFKSEYIKFKERHDEFMEKYRNMPEEDKLYPNGDEKREFKPFQITSKSETYKDIDFLNALDFIKSQQKLEQILLLFGEESKGNLDIKDLKKYFASPNRLDTEA